ncbi:MAG: hypothetical protein C5S43_03790 [Candidatus Methanocomedens sp.]|nr:MAG: hypothetical protein C5S43_03790 [ANME-2 cluster archaeon]
MTTRWEKRWPNEAPHSRAVGYLMSQATEVALTIACPNRSRAAGYNEYDQKSLMIKMSGKKKLKKRTK